MTELGLQDVEQPEDANSAGAAAAFRDELRARIDANPFAAVAVASTVGFALGGGVTRGMLTLLLGAAARAVGARLSEVILESGRNVPQEETQ